MVFLKSFGVLNWCFYEIYKRKYKRGIFGIKLWRKIKKKERNIRIMSIKIRHLVT